ncbi:MmpS family transport accessory protein [Streptomyces sp. bgisy022]|uniref:MmpS family transport accessory protein n=1 Tax=Streptomyces sp. bgisy022 TaxID=3413769 RepID=UPI003D736C46
MRTMAMATAGVVLLLGCSGVGDEVAEKAEDELVKEVDRQIDQEYEVTYEVTGDKADFIEFNAGGGDASDPQFETVDDPELPWRKTVKLRGIEAPTVLPVLVDADEASGGRLTCRILHDGKKLAEKSGAGAVSATGCVAVSPIAQ